MNKKQELKAYKYAERKLLSAFDHLQVSLSFLSEQEADPVGCASSIQGHLNKASSELSYRISWVSRKRMELEAEVAEARKAVA